MLPPLAKHLVHYFLFASANPTVPQIFYFADVINPTVTVIISYSK